MNDVDRVVAGMNPVPRQEVARVEGDRGAQDLMERILAGPAKPELSPARRPWVLPVAAALTAAAVLVGLTVWPGRSRQPNPVTGVSQVRLVVFTKQGGKVIARITDPFAAGAQLSAAFRDHGIHYGVTTVPVSPSMVGTIVFEDINSGPSPRTLETGHCFPGGGVGCAIGLVFPDNFKGSGYIVVGRPARPGEQYESTADSFAPGEALHCSGILRKPASAAVPVLRAKGLRVWWRPTPGRSYWGWQNPPNQYVLDATPDSSTSVIVWTGPRSATRGSSWPGFLRAVDYGC